MEKVVLLCQPVQPEVAVLPDSIQRECNDCGRKVWVSLSGQKLIRDKSAIILCPACTTDMLAKEPGPHEIKVTPETAREVEAWRRRN